MSNPPSEVTYEKLRCLHMIDAPHLHHELKRIASALAATVTPEPIEPFRDHESSRARMVANLAGSAPLAVTLPQADAEISADVDDGNSPE